MYDKIHYKLKKNEKKIKSRFGKEKKNTVFQTKLKTIFSKDLYWLIGYYAFQPKVNYPGFLVAQIA